MITTGEGSDHAQGAEEKIFTVGVVMRVSFAPWPADMAGAFGAVSGERTSK